jgi:Mrp family chromosome partitioning ATPase
VLPDGALQTVNITAVGTDPKRVEQLASAFSEELIRYMNTHLPQQYETQSKVLRATLAEKQKQYAAVPAKGATPAQTNGYDAQRRVIENAINDTQNKLAALRQNTPSSSGLTLLQKGRANPTSQQQIDQLQGYTTSTKGVQTSGAAGAQQAAATQQVAANQGPPNPVTRGWLGGAAGLMLGLCLTLVLDRFDNRIRNKLEAEEAFDLPVIAEIPPLTKSQLQSERVITFDEPRSLYAEAIRALRSTLVFAGSPHPGADEFAASAPAGDPAGGASAPRSDGQVAKVIMITSPGPAEGKTTTAANLAAILAEGGLSVLAVNCDYRRPRLHVFLGGKDAIRKVVDTEIPGVKAVTNVTSDRLANPSDVVAAQCQVIERAKPHFDVILLDTAPLLTTNDAIDLVEMVDLVVLIAGVGRTTHEAAFRAAEMLQRRDAPVAGVALVGADETPTYHYYYYYSRAKVDQSEEAAA